MFLSATLNAFVSQPGVLFGKSHDGFYHDLSDAWPAGLPFVAGIIFLRDEFPMPAQNSIRGKDRGQLL